MEIADALKESYIKGFLKDGKRADSRGMLEFRDIKIKRGTIDHAEGSAEIELGDTKVLAAVKLVLESPMEDTPDQGNLIINAELLPFASAEYETGPPTPESIEFARVVDRGIRAGNCIDLKNLFIEEGKAWTVFVDLYVLNYDGNLLDAGEFAAMSALLNAKVPKYEDGKAIMKERVKKLKVDNIVASTTFGKIDNHLLLDMNGNEEKAANARITIATDGENIRAMQKGLNGSFNKSEIEKLLDSSFEHYDELKKIIQNE
jgi:exosome complex component RRP42